MRILLDSHIVVWLAEDSPKLPAEAKDLLNDPKHDFSSALPAFGNWP